MLFARGKNAKQVRTCVSRGAAKDADRSSARRPALDRRRLSRGRDGRGRLRAPGLGFCPGPTGARRDLGARAELVGCDHREAREKGCCVRWRSGLPRGAGGKRHMPARVLQRPREIAGDLRRTPSRIEDQARRHLTLSRTHRRSPISISWRPRSTGWYRRLPLTPRDRRRDVRGRASRERRRRRNRRRGPLGPHPLAANSRNYPSPL